METKLTKRQARKLYNNGRGVILIASKMRLNGICGGGHQINVKQYECKFDDIVNSFRQFNCNKEMGKVVSFYEPYKRNEILY